MLRGMSAQLKKIYLKNWTWERKEENPGSINIYVHNIINLFKLFMHAGAS